LAVERTELCVLRSDSEVAPEREFEPSTETVAIHGGDRRFPRLESREPERSCPVGLRVMGQLEQLREIAACTERALAGSGNHENERVRVGSKGVDRLRKRQGHLDADRIGCLRASQCQLSNVSEVLECDQLATTDWFHDEQAHSDNRAC
jgi:hypothetical protein